MIRPIVGFTGTRDGMSDQQWQDVRELLMELDPSECHHGDCEGADEDFHMICLNLDIRVVLHPPVDTRFRAHCKDAIAREPAEYLARNHNIVDACDILLATPKSVTMERRSGTWSTVRYALKQDKKVQVFAP